MCIRDSKYLGASTWTLLQGEMSIAHKIETLCRLMVSRCFLRNPDESTRRDMVALVYKASSTDTINAAETLKHVQRARTIFKSLRQLNPGPKGPKTYPSDPIVFQSIFQSSTILTDDPPRAITHCRRRVAHCTEVGAHAQDAQFRANACAGN